MRGSKAAPGCACAILREDRALTHAELLAFLQEREIARFKLPEPLEIVNKFPISPAGKILIPDCRQHPHAFA